ncbi:MAG TPA: dTDP-glucose 4,6-dehydratase [Myxococcota bacterium]|nr:dTDP-glucose 4,6-dehydratase [Myxococcota bacterium]
MTILITGAAGFIGSNFVYHMLRAHSDLRLVALDKLTYAGNLDNFSALTDSERARFRVAKGDINDRPLVERLFGEENFTAVVNFAAETHVDRSIHEPEIFLTTNILGTHGLLRVCKDRWLAHGTWEEGRRFVQVSTDEVYGSLGPEGFFSETTPLDPHSPYSASKAAADMMVKAYHDTYGMPVLTTRCSNNYGPYQFPEKLIPLMIINALAHRELPVYGDGRQVRDWIHVDDHCRAIEMVLSGGTPGSVYNIGGGNERENVFIVGKLIDILSGMTGDAAICADLIRNVEDRPGHDRRYAIDAGKIESELGWKPEVRFEEGLERTIRWYLDNRAWTEKVISGEYTEFYEKNYKNR